MKLSDYVLKFIADQGVRHVFLVTGGGAMHLNQSLATETRLTPVCNSHEQASAMGAEAYAKATNGLGVCMVTTGPGGTNAVTGVAGAWLDSTPTLFLSGQVKRPDRMFDAAGRRLGVRQLGAQEIDIVAIVSPITKYAVTVLEPQQIRFQLEKAVYLACTGRPGPVWLDIPLDVQATSIDECELPGFLPEENEGVPVQVLREQVAEAIAAFRTSARPLIFAGNGIRLSRAEAEFDGMRTVLSVPTVATWCAADLVPSNSPTFVGRPGNLASRGANFALQNCDFLLALGVRLDFAITGYAPQNLARAAYKVVVDIDAAELEKLDPHIQRPVCADAKAFIQEFMRQFGVIDGPRFDDWKARCADWKTRYPVVTDEHRRSAGAVSIFNFADVVGRNVDAKDKIVVGSSGAGIEIFLFACPTLYSQRLYHTAGLGSMGYCIPSAIAVSVAHPGCRVVAVDGDGGFMFNVQELETIARLQLPIKLFVLNNDGYSSIRASQRAYFGKATIGADRDTGLTVPNLQWIGQSFGLKTCCIVDQSNLEREVLDVLAMEGPVICDLRVLPDEMRGPRVQSYQKPDGTFVSRPLEDLFPFLPREEFLANMIVEPLLD